MLEYAMRKNSAQLLFEEAEKRKLSPQWETKYGLFSYQLEHEKRYLFFSKLPFNSQLAADFAFNKHFTHIILDQAGLPSIPYCVPDNQAQAQTFLNTYQNIIIKPTRGKRSSQVKRLSTSSDLSSLNLESMILEQYIAGTEVRYLTLFGKVIGVIQKHSHPLSNRPWHKQHETLSKSQWDSKLSQLATQAAKALQLNWGAVDFIVSSEQKPVILEVNSAPGLSVFHNPDKGKPINIAKMVFDKLITW